MANAKPKRTFVWECESCHNLVDLHCPSVYGTLYCPSCGGALLLAVLLPDGRPSVLMSPAGVISAVEFVCALVERAGRSLTPEEPPF